jgi:hypothetical protein
MRKLILATAASAAMIAASLLPIGGAQAVTPGTASGVHAALAETNLSESVVLVCRRGYYGRRVCWDRPGYYGGYYGGGYGPGYYGGYPGYYGGYYGPGVGIYGPGVGIGIGIGPRWGW